MAALKVILWILVIQLALFLLTGLTITALMSVSIGVNADYDDEGTRLKLKYGFLGFQILPKKEKKEKKPNKLMNNLKYRFGPTVHKFVDKGKAKVSTVMGEKKVEKELKNEEELKTEQTRIQKEETRLNAEMEKAESTGKAAEQSVPALPEVVDESKVSKLDSMKQKLDSFDLEGAYNSFRSFTDGFDFDSIIALLSFIGKQTKGTLKKTGKRVHIKQFSLGLRVSGEDAAKTALKYGRIAMVAFPALERMVSNMAVRKYDLDLTPDYLANKDKAELHTSVSFRPIRVLSPFLGYLFRVGKKSLNFYKNGKKTMDSANDKRKEETHDKLIRQTADQLAVTKSEN